MDLNAILYVTPYTQSIIIPTGRAPRNILMGECAFSVRAFFTLTGSLELDHSTPLPPGSALLDSTGGAGPRPHVHGSCQLQNETGPLSKDEE